MLRGRARGAGACAQAVVNGPDAEYEMPQAGDCREQLTLRELLERRLGVPETGGVRPVRLDRGDMDQRRVVLAAAGVRRQLRDERVVLIGRHAGGVEQDEHVRLLPRAEEQL